MGIMESKLHPQTVKALVRQDSLTTLPSFSMDTAKFSDGSSGFVITTVDLAKNSNVRTISIKFVYSPAENSLVFVGNDETVLSFVRDRLTGGVVCSVSSVSKENVVRFCVTTYEPIDDAMIDKIGEIYTKQVQRPS
ncbi:MAG: hypothetical protein EBU66_17875 [Bacteroidetes bacterium]|jgi:hypothetical protein|nr:hypothetical protein [Bacteroidota bacterium]